jgi:hypothetical protein
MEPMNATVRVHEDTCEVWTGVQNPLAGRKVAAAALFDEVTLRDGAVVQSDFFDYPLPKLADAPRVAVEFVESTAPMGGLGERAAARAGGCERCVCSDG